MKKVMMIAMMAAFICAGGYAAESKWQSDATSAAVTFGPISTARRIIKAVFATSDKARSVVKIYARGGAGKAAPSATPTNAALIIYVANTGNLYTTNDHVVYVHVNGTLDKTTVSANTASNCTLAAGITVAGASGDYLYELTQQGEIFVGETEGTHAFTNDAVNLTGDLYAAPGDSPLYVVLDGNSNAVLTVTVE